MSKSPTMRLIEVERGEQIEAIIRARTEAGLTQEEIADELGISYATLRVWLRNLGADYVKSVRFKSEQRDVTPVG